jgi:hypothetical protein
MIDPSSLQEMEESETIISHLYPLPKQLNISNQSELLKLQFCTLKSLQKVKKFKID